MKTFVVLGMHRSATSLISQGLFKCNVYVGDTLLGANESNPYGHWEDVDFVSFNDRILSYAGGSWDKPPSEDEIIRVGKQMATEISQFIKKKERRPLWGWKDPRTTLTIRAFHPHLQNPHYFACYRDPIDVGNSLERRGDMTSEEGVLLSTEYNLRLNRFLNDFYTGRI